MPYLDGAEIDYEARATGGQLQIRAPKIKGEAPPEAASLVERVRCGLVDVTLKQGIEKPLMDKVPGVTAVRDATDHETGDAPYMPRDVA